MSSSSDRILTRWPAARPFLVAASASIVTGGLVAALSRPTAFGLGSWTAAFLVLIGGVAQLVLGAGAAWLGSASPSMPKVRTELLAWNLGVVTTIGGTFAASPPVTTVGGLGLVVAGAAFVTSPHSATSRRPRWVPGLWWATWLMVISSVPVGIALGWARR